LQRLCKGSRLRRRGRGRERLFRRRVRRDAGERRGRRVDAGLNCASSCDFAGGVVVGCATRFQYGINFAWDQFSGDFGGIEVIN